MGSGLGNTLHLLSCHLQLSQDRGLGDHSHLMTNCMVILGCGLLTVTVKERTKSPPKEPCLHPCFFMPQGSQVE